MFWLNLDCSEHPHFLRHRRHQSGQRVSHYPHNHHYYHIQLDHQSYLVWQNLGYLQ